jgi:hypothetical protein
MPEVGHVVGVAARGLTSRARARISVVKTTENWQVVRVALPAPRGGSCVILHAGAVKTRALRPPALEWPPGGSKGRRHLSCDSVVIRVVVRESCVKGCRPAHATTSGIPATSP